MSQSHDPKGNKATILIVDDTPENIDILDHIISPWYRTKVALNGEKALKIAQSATPPDLILLDIMMPVMDGYAVCKALKSNPATSAIPVIFVSAMSEVEDERHGLAVGAVDYLTKPVNAAIVLARIKTHLALYDQTRELTRLVDLRTAELLKTRLQVIRRLGRAAEFRDNETGNHVIRMSHYARLVAQQLGMSEAAVDNLYYAAPMHDIGKIGIPDHILLKPGKLDPDEWDVMRQHAEIGAEIIGHHNDHLLNTAQTIAMYHHEKWDGTGYPRGLKGLEIPLEARIVAIADVFDALTSERPYKSAWTVEDAARHIEEQGGRHFDPALIAPFKACLPQIVAIKDQFSDRHGALADADLH